MKQADNLVALVNLWHEYVKTNPESSIEDFCKAHLLKQEKEPSCLPFTSDSEVQDLLAGRPLLAQVGILFGRITRFGLMYSKKALQHLNLSSAIDFNYLRNLNEHESLKKSELIFLSITDFTTGIEAIKRLIKNRYAEEYPDPNDKRSKRIKITAVGREILLAGYEQMHQLASVSFVNLSEEEMQSLLKIFQKMNHHHTNRFKDVRNMDFETIVKKTLSEKK